MFNYKEVNNLKVKVVVLIFSTTHTCQDEFLFTIYSCGTLFTKSSCTAASAPKSAPVKYI
jgi:hypothetical protein